MTITNTKYELTDRTIEHEGRTLHRIRALRDLPRYGVRAGVYGGYVESTNNLDWHDDSWIALDAKVYGAAVVYGTALVTGQAEVYEDATVNGEARVSQNARVYGEATVNGNALIYGAGRVYGSATVRGEGRVSGIGRVYGSARVDDSGHVADRAEAYEMAQVRGQSRASGDSRVYDTALVSGRARLQGNARVFGTAYVTANAMFEGEARVSNVRHYLNLGPFGSEDVGVTLSRADNEEGNMLVVGCWTGTVDGLMEEVTRRQSEEWDDEYTEAFQSLLLTEYQILEELCRARMKSWDA